VSRVGSAVESVARETESWEMVREMEVSEGGGGAAYERGEEMHRCSPLCVGRRVSFGADKGFSFSAVTVEVRRDLHAG